MKLLVPDYYKNFICIADRCRNNCCIGWEIDIDENTLEYYENVPGEFGNRLRSGITHGETPCFKLDEGERCVFLNEHGLCDIILNLGEDALCDICTDHPRFRNFFDDRTEMGLGLCCEEACRIILGHNEPMKLIDIVNDGKAMPDPLEAEFFAERQHIFDILQNRSLPIFERLASLSREYGIVEDHTAPAEWSKFYRSLERLDPEWDRYLDILSECSEFTLPCNNDTVWEMLVVYLIYRHAANISLTDAVSFALHTVRLIHTLCSAVSADFREICEICRMWSSEIEYSEENTASIIEKI